MAITASGIWYPVLPDNPPTPASSFGTLRSGVGVPSNDVGNNGDVFTNTAGDVYLKYGDVWNISQGAAGGSGEIGVGSPEGVTTASPGTTYLDSSNGFFYIKQSGVGNTGWLLIVG